jgi:putative hydrolase of the HAD superfamily
MPLDWSQWTVVLDLDDTLYLEAEYQASGYRFLVNMLCLFYDLDRDRLESLVDEGGDVLGSLANYLGVPQSKESLLWAYRLHDPAIALTPDSRDFLAYVEGRAAGIYIVTDGRAITQRLKLSGLGISHFPALISEEFGAQEKPSFSRFLEIQEKSPTDNYLYIGDNVAKDFLAPNKLGWITIGRRPSELSIHNNNLPDAYPNEYQPTFWVEKLTEVEALL